MLSGFVRSAVCGLVLLAGQAQAQAQEAGAPNPAARYAGPHAGFDLEGGRTGSLDPGDVWSLSSFQLGIGSALELELGPCTAVFGRRGSPAEGYSALWAVVLPLGPAALRSKAGGEEEVTSVHLRFHPERVAELFPAETVEGPGPALELVEARRIHCAKIESHGRSPELPAFPRATSLVVDVETAERARRVFHAQKRRVQLLEGFEPLLDPPDAAISPQDALLAFDQAWRSIDLDYASFGLRPSLRWLELKELYRPLAQSARTRYQTAAVIAQLYSTLADPRAYVRLGHEYLPVFEPLRLLNANWEATREAFGQELEDGQGLTWGVNRKKIGYLGLWGLTDENLVAAVDEALEELGDTRGLLLDLRLVEGGDEEVAGLIAGRFLESEQIYATRRTRSGPGHADLGQALELTVEPRGPWRYGAPVVVLVGNRTADAGETLVLMLSRAPQVTTFGHATAGARGSVQPYRLAGDIEVAVPTSFDADAEDRSLGASGIAPHILVEGREAAVFAEEDPLFEAALRHMIKNRGRQAARKD